MATISLNQIADKINLMPINGIRICKHGEGIDDIIYIHNIEAESSYNIKPILRHDHLGNSRTLGYKIDITVYIAHNLLTQLPDGEPDIIHELNNIWSLGVDYYHFILMIGDAAINPPASGYINTSQNIGMWLELRNPVLNIEIESVVYRPRLIIKTNYFSKTLTGILL